MTLKPGDRVRIKTWEELVKLYGQPDDRGIIRLPSGAAFRNEMKSFCGKEATIEKGDSPYTIDLDHWEWFWHDGMFDLLTAQADGVTDEEIEAEAKLCFPYSTTDTNSDAIVVLQRGAFWTCAKWLRSKLEAPKTDGGRPTFHAWDLSGRCMICGALVETDSLTICNGQPLPAPPKTTE